MNKLSKLYDKLTPEERLPLIVKACARGDKLERDRLVRTSPNIALAVEDYYGQADALERMAWAYLTEQLRLLVIFLQETGNMQPHEPFPAYVKYVAYLFAINADAWHEFCADLKIEPDAPIEGLPAFELLKRHDPTVRLTALTIDEANTFASPEASAVTVQELVGMMHKCYEIKVEK